MRNWRARWFAIGVCQMIAILFGVSWWQTLILTTPAYWAGLMDGGHNV